MWLWLNECMREVILVSLPTQPEPRRSPRRREIGAILVMAFAILTLVSLHSSASGAVGLALSQSLRRAFGSGADLPALLLLYLGVAVLRARRGSGRARKFAALLLGFLSGLTGYHMILTERAGPLTPYWAIMTGEGGQAGGALGGYLSSKLLSAFGTWGSAVVLTAVFVIAIALFMESSLSKAAASVARFLFSLLFGGVRGVGGFFSGVAEELRELRARLTDARALRAKEAEAQRARAVQARSLRVGEEPSSDGGKEAWKAFFRRFGREEEAGEPSPAAPAVRRRPGGSAASTSEYAAAAGEESDDRPAWDGAVRSEGEPPSESVRRPATRRGGEAGEGADERGSQLSRSGQAPPIAPTSAYTLPTSALLQRPKEPRGKRPQEAGDQSRLLEETLATFGVQAKVVTVSRGPVITRYELQPAPGIKVSKIVNLADDLALSLAAADVRIEAPVPGKSVVGIEVPNKETSAVYMREVLESDAFLRSESKLVAALGKDIAGNPVIADLTKLLHVLIAGATGSGKSVCINTIICSLLYKAQPHEVKLMMIDPKRVELAVYDGIPHLITPVVTDPKLAANALRWAVKEMESRYKQFSEAGVRNITGYNEAVDQGEVEGERMPYLVIIIDELADLMLVAQNDVEDSICRLAQMARAAGIHLVIATQRPSVDVITGLIKANVPSRIAFAVSSGVDSRTILDMIGAERLIGKGDMLYYPIGASKPLRAQGAFISDKDVQEVVAFWKKQGEPEYAESVTEVARASGGGEEGDDELYDDAVQLVVETGNASISMLQRRFRIGYARAARLIDMMELAGVVGPYQGSKPREVLKSDISEVG